MQASDAPCKSFLVTGATGFIGACLTRRLVEERAEVHVLTRRQSIKWRIHDVLHAVREHEVDLMDAPRLQEVVSAIKPKVIFHCAAYGGYPFQQDMDEIIRVNVLGTVNLVKALSRVDFDCFINTGSSSEYGLKAKAMAEDDVLEPASAYGATKAAATLFCQAFAKANRRPVLTLRLFSPFGFYEDPSRLVPTVISHCLLNKPLKLTAGEQKRDFVFIDDVIDAYLKASGATHLGGEIFNVGSGVQYAIKDIGERIRELCGSTGNLEWGAIPDRKGESQFWVASTSKTHRMLGWTPRYDLQRGLARTIDWVRENLTVYR